MTYSNKKGNVGADSIVVLIVLFVFGIAAIIGFKAFDEINTDLQADPDLSANAKATVSTTHTQYPSLFDNIFLIVFILLWALVVVASFNIDSHPVFFAFSIILLMFILIVAAQLSNTFEEFADDEDLASAASAFPIANFVMDNIVVIILMIAASIMIVLYGKSRIG